MLLELLHHFVQKSDVPLALGGLGHTDNVGPLSMHLYDAASVLESSEVERVLYAALLLKREVGAAFGLLAKRVL